MSSASRQVLLPVSLLFILMAASLFGMAEGASAQSTVVRGLFFYSPTCPHCHKVLSEDLPPLMEQYGDQLQFLFVDVSSEGGHELYGAAISTLNIPAARQGVPTVVVGEEVLVGSLEIPERLPGIIEAGLVAGGIPWPEIPGLAQIVASVEDAGEEADPAEPNPAESDPIESDPVEAEASTLRTRFGRDPVGNSLSVAVIVAMIGGLTLGVQRWRQAAPRRGASRREARDDPLNWLLPLLLLGLVVAGYLAYVETTQTEPVCGPVGDCSTVQTSQYAYLFGIPIGTLGVAGYVAMLAAWVVGRWAREPLGDLALVALASMALVGTLYSLYLTVLEPFVIGATCMWCLTSAAVMTALFLLAAGPARRSLSRLAGDRARGRA